MVHDLWDTFGLRHLGGNEHCKGHPFDGRFQGEMLGDRNGRADLLSDLERVAEEFVWQYLVKGYFNDLRDRKDGPLVPADQSEQDAAFAIAVELVFVRFLRQPVRPQARSRTQHGAQPDTVTSGSADAAARFQSKLLEELT